MPMSLAYESSSYSVILGIALIAFGIWGLQFRFGELVGFAFGSESIRAPISCKQTYVVRESRFKRGNYFKSEDALITRQYNYCVDAGIQLRITDRVERQIGDSIEITYIKADPSVVRIGGFVGTLVLWSMAALIGIALICIGVLRVLLGVREMRAKS